MPRRFSREQILAFLRQAAAGTPVMDLCWNHCFSRSTFRAWKMKYGDTIDARGNGYHLSAKAGEAAGPDERRNSR